MLEGQEIFCYSQSPAHPHLSLAGVVRIEDQKLVPRNRIYQKVFDMEWIKENRPRCNDGKKTIRIVLSSPGDVKEERAAMEKVIEELNRGVAADRNLHLELSRWETDVYPGFHTEGPQGLINSVLKI